MSHSYHSRLYHLALISAALLAFSLPFEITLARIGPLQLTNLELLLGLTLLLVGALVYRQRRWQAKRWLRAPRAWLWLWAALAVAALLSALLTPEFRLNALKATGRLMGGMLLALAVPQLIQGTRQLAVLVLPLLVGGFLASIAGLAELAIGFMPVLDLFRVQVTTIGPFLRLTGSFDHANQAAMFLEATVPLLVATLVAWQRRWWLAAGGAVFIYLQAMLLTYSRAALASVLLSNAAVAVLLWRRRRGDAWRRALPWALLAAFIPLLLAVNVPFNPVMGLRFRSEGDNEWYRLQFDVPASLTVEASSTVTTTITVRNEGLLTWPHRGPLQVRLGGHWYLSGNEESLAHVPRWSLPEPVQPGEEIALQVPLRVPGEAGTYRLQWDMVQESVTWFSHKNNIRPSTTVAVLERESPPEPRTAQEATIDVALEKVVEAPTDLAPIPGRRTLWRIAAQQFMARPLVGIGLDNFRLVYGRALDHEQWNESIHTNNWYVEMLVSLGLLGALPFFGWVLLLIFYMIRLLRSRHVTMWQAALGVALFAYFIHGLLDYFLMFNNTGLLFWMLAGLWLSQAHPREGSKAAQAPPAASEHS